MDYLVTGSRLLSLKKTEEYYIKTEDGREIIATKIESMETVAWTFKGGNLSREEIGELQEFLTTLER
jgi:hypothetical protein